MEQWISIAALVVAVVVGIFVFVQRDTPFTATAVGEAIQRVQPTAIELETVANIIVGANEQRKREGELTNEQAYHDALNTMRGWWGRDVPFTNDQILRAINSAILIASAATAQINMSKSVVDDA